MTTLTETIDQVQKQARAEGVPDDLIAVMVAHLKDQPDRPRPITSSADEILRDFRELEALLRHTNLAAMTPDFIRAGIGYEEARRILHQTGGRAGLITAHLNCRRAS